MQLYQKGHDEEEEYKIIRRKRKDEEWVEEDEKKKKMKWRKWRQIMEEWRKGKKINAKMRREIKEEQQQQNWKEERRNIKHTNRRQEKLETLTKKGPKIKVKQKKANKNKNKIRKQMLTHACTQCAAVKTQSGCISDPPHAALSNCSSGLMKLRPTCQGQEKGEASFPPTTRGEVSLLRSRISPAIPQGLCLEPEKGHIFLYFKGQMIQLEILHI